MMESKMYELMEKIYADFVNFREDMASFQKNTQARFDAIEVNMATKQDTQKIETKVEKLEAKLENETNDKIRALFDNRVIVNEKFDELNERLNDIQIDINGLTRKIAKSDTQIIEIKRNLKEVK